MRGCDVWMARRILFILAATFLTVCGCDRVKPAVVKVKSPVTDADEPHQTEDAWKYAESKDEMRGTVSKYATKKSVNTVNFDFPYQGVQHGTIMISDNYVLFYVEKGQIICHGGGEYGTCLVLVKFDDGKERYVQATKSGDDSATIDFTEPGFLEDLKRSKKLMIQVNVYHNGLPVFTFDVSGLDEERLQTKKGQAN